MCKCEWEKEGGEDFFHLSNLCAIKKKPYQLTWVVPHFPFTLLMAFFSRNDFLKAL